MSYRRLPDSDGVLGGGEAVIGHPQGGGEDETPHFLFSSVLSFIADASIGSNSKTKQHQRPRKLIRWFPLRTVF